MLRRPHVSVITSCYNTAKYVEECVHSVQATVTCDRFRVDHIVVDDGSTDDSARVLHDLAWSLRDSKIPLRVVELARNTGKPSKVRNEGVRRATGRYLFCLDADDILMQNTLRYFLEHFRGKAASRWAYSDFIRSGPNLEYCIGDDYWGWPHATPQDLLYSVFNGDHFYQHSIMCERALFREVGGYDPEICIGEDLDLCVRFVMAGCMPTHLPLISHIHRQHGTNMTANFGRKDHLENMRSHYAKHKFALTQWLTAEQVTVVERSIGLAQPLGIEVLVEGDLHVERADAEQLLSIKRGGGLSNG